MAKVARSQRQVREQAMSYGQSSTKAARTADMGPALQQASQIINQVSGIANKWQKDSDDVEMAAFGNKLRDAQNKAMHDKDTGFSKVRGKTTAESYLNYKEGYDKFVADEIGGLSERLRERATILGDRHKIDLDNQLNSHIGREMEAHDDAVFKASMESFKANAIANMSISPSKVMESISAQNGEIEKYAKRKGYDTKRTDMLKLEAASNVHSSAIQQMLNQGNDLLAKQYYERQIKDGQISGKDAPGLSRMLRSSSIKGSSQRIVGDIGQKTVKGEGGEERPLNYTESIAAIKADPRSKDPEVRDASIQRYKLEFQEAKVAKTFAENEYFQNLGDKMMADPQNFDLTAKDRANLSFAQQRQLVSAKSQILQEQMGGKSVVDWKEYDRLINLSPQDLAKEKIYDNKGLNNAKKNELLNAKKDNKAHTSLQSVGSYISKLVKSVGPDTFEEESYIRNLFERQLNTYPVDKRDSSDTWSLIQDNILMEMDEDWWGASTPLWKIRKEGLSHSGPDKAPAKSIPKSAVFKDTMIGGVPVAGWVDESSGFIYNNKGQPTHEITKK